MSLHVQEPAQLRSRLGLLAGYISGKFIRVEHLPDGSEVGEKLVTFAQAAERRPEFARELPRFLLRQGFEVHRSVTRV